jgi:hypothetical protein
MMLEVTLGEHVAVRFDDEMVDQRPTPEQVEDYLTRMRRTAMAMWDGSTDEIVPALTEGDEQP